MTTSHLSEKTSSLLLVLACAYFTVACPARALFDEGNGIQGSPLVTHEVLSTTDLAPLSTVEPLVPASPGGGFMAMSIPTTTTLPTNSIPAEYLALTDVELLTNAILDKLVADYETNALALYSYVLNHVDFRASPWSSDLSMKGALGCYLEREGNSVDLASLVIYLLRRCGIPCAYGNMYGPSMDADAYCKTYGFEVLASGEGAYAVNKALVYAYLSTNGVSTNWVSLVPWWKEREYVEGVEFRDVLTNNYESGEGILDAYSRRDAGIQAAIDNSSDLLLDFLPEVLTTNLENNLPNTSLDQVGVRWKLTEQFLTNWPTEYEIDVAETNVTAAASLSGDQREKITIVFRRLSDNAVMYTNSAESVIFHNRRVLLYFEPATASDWQTVTNYGGYYEAGTNFEMLAVIDLGATPQYSTFAVTSSPSVKVRMGQGVKVQVDEGSRNVEAGSYEALVFDLGRVTEAMLDQHVAVLEDLSTYTKQNTNATWDVIDSKELLGEQVCTLGFNYYHLLSKTTRRCEEWSKSRVMNNAHVGSFFFALGESNGTYYADSANVDIFAGRVGFAYLHYKQSYTDGPYRNTEPRAQERDFFCLRGLAGSALEHGILQGSLGVSKAMSTVRDLRFTTESGGYITNLYNSTYSTSANSSLISNVDAAAYAEVEAFFNTHPDGRLWFPSQGVTNGSYAGYGRIELDVNTSGTNWVQYFMIQGGTFGGAGQTQSEEGQEASSFSQGGTDAAISDYTPPEWLLTPLVMTGPDGVTVVIDFAGQNSAISADSLAASGGSSADTATYSAYLDRDWAGVDYSSTWFLDDVATFYDLGAISDGDTYTDSHQDAMLAWSDSGSYGNAWGDAFVQVGAAVADPVDIRTGEFYIDDVDLFIPGPKPIVFKRAYSSQYGAVGEFGFGWRFNYASYLAVNPDETEIRAVEADGSVLRYTNAAANVWVSSIELNERLANENRNGIGSTANPYLNKITRVVVSGVTNYTLRTAAGDARTYEVISYADASLTRRRPYLAEWKDANGNTLTFSYGSDSNLYDYGRINEVRNSNHFVKLNYNLAGRIVEAITDDGRMLRYEYGDGGDLTASCRPDESFVLYEYLQEEATNGVYSTHLVTKVTRPGGRVLENTYDDERRVVEQKATVGLSAIPVRNATFTYLGDGINGTTISSNIFGAAITYVYTNGLLTETIDALGGTETKEWDDQHNLVEHIDKRDTSMRYYYDADGNPTNIYMIGDLLGDGTVTTSVTWRTYNTNNLLASTTTPRGDVTRLFYDDNRNLVTQELCYADSDPWAPTNNTVYSRTILQYDEHGWLTNRTVAAGTADEASSSFTYDSDGNLLGSETDPGYGQQSISVANVYNSRGWAIRTTDPVGIYKQLQHDVMGRVIAQDEYDSSDTLLRSMQFEFDENGNLLNYDGPRTDLDDSVARTYDRMDRVVTQARSHYDVWYKNYGLKGPMYTLVATPTVTDTYDGFGNLIESTDARTNITRFTHDALGQLLHATNYQADGSSPLADSHWWYDAGGLVVSNQSPRGFVAETSHNALGQPILRVYADDTYEQWRYDLTGLTVTQYINQKSVETHSQYDDFGRLTNRIAAAGTADEVTMAFTYDRRNNRVSATDAQTYTTTYVHDDANRLVQETGPSGDSPQVVWSNRYDGTGRLLERFGPESYITNAYDGLGRLVFSARFKNGSSIPAYQESSQYDEAGNRQQLIIGATETNRFFHDAAGRIGVVRYGDDTGVTNRYDVHGNLTSRTDEVGHHTFYTYDELHRRITVTEPDGVTITNQFDAEGNRTNVLYPHGLQYVRTFDERGRLETEKVFGDDDGEYLSRTYGYDANGNLATQLTGRGVTIVTTRDNLDRRTAVEATALDPFVSSVSLSMDYTANGWLFHADDGTRSMDRAFDQYGRVLSETNTADGVALACAQTFDGEGRRASFLLPSFSDAWSNHWDGAGRLTNIDWSSSSFDLTYDGRGYKTSVSGPGFVRTNVWAIRHRLESFACVHGGPGAEDFHSQQAVYRADGQRTDHSMIYTGRSYSSTYFYDDCNRLMRQRTLQAGASVWNWITNEYEYGACGNRTNYTHTETDGGPDWSRAARFDEFRRLTSETTTITGTPPAITVSGYVLYSTNVLVKLNGTNQGYAAVDTNTHLWTLSGVQLSGGSNVLTAVADPDELWATNIDSTVTIDLFVRGSYAYDADGNLVYANRGNKDISYVYDALGRLVGATERDQNGDGFNWAAECGPLGRRIGTSYALVTNNTPILPYTYTRTLRDPLHPMQEVLVITDEGTPTTNIFLYGSDMSDSVGGLGGIGGLLAVKESNEVRQVVSDMFGNVLALVETNGAAVWNPRYTNFRPTAAPTLNAPSFATRRYDPTGLIYMGARYYDPIIGRFTQPDPARFADSRDLYAYVRNNPINRVDPDGRLSSSQQNAIGVVNQPGFANQEFSGRGLNHAVSLDQNYPASLRDAGVVAAAIVGRYIPGANIAFAVGDVVQSASHNISLAEASGDPNARISGVSRILAPILLGAIVTDMMFNQPEQTPETPHTISGSRPPNGGSTGQPNSIWEQRRDDGSRSVTYFDEQGHRFSREDYGQLGPHGELPTDATGRAAPHEHGALFNEQGQPIGRRYRQLDETGMPVGDWIDD